jgi:hypothetical protein
MPIRADFELVEGDTEPVILQLYEMVDGASTDLDGTGLTLSALAVTGADDQVVSTAGKFAWHDQAAGQVAYSQGATDLKAEKSPYRVRAIVTDGAGDVRAYPSDKFGYLLGVSKR